MIHYAWYVIAAVVGVLAATLLAGSWYAGALAAAAALGWTLTRRTHDWRGPLMNVAYGVAIGALGLLLRAR